MYKLCIYLYIQSKLIENKRSGENSLERRYLTGSASKNAAASLGHLMAAQC